MGVGQEGEVFRCAQPILGLVLASSCYLDTSFILSRGIQDDTQFCTGQDLCPNKGAGQKLPCSDSLGFEELRCVEGKETVCKCPAELEHDSYTDFFHNVEFMLQFGEAWLISQAGSTASLVLHGAL